MSEYGAILREEELEAGAVRTVDVDKSVVLVSRRDRPESHRQASKPGHEKGRWKCVPRSDLRIIGL